VALLEQSLRLLPADQRPGFWRDAVQRDTALASLSGHAGFARLDRRYGTPR
jgi:hypothetical protein